MVRVMSNIFGVMVRVRVGIKVALTIALSLAVARLKQARHAVRVDTWLCEGLRCM